jgi:hypothetical protein
VCVTDIFSEVVFQSNPIREQHQKNGDQQQDRKQFLLAPENETIAKVEAVKGKKTGYRINGHLLKRVIRLITHHENSQEGLVEHVHPEGDVDQYFVLLLHLK